MRKRQNEQIIYEAALKQFAKYGYKKTTLDSIGAKLNMTNANLYSYATSKQALYRDSVTYAMTKWQNRVLDAITGIEDTSELFVTLCDSAVTYLSEDKVFCQILRADPDIFPMFPTIDPYEEINQRSYDVLKTVLDKGVADGTFIEMDTAHMARLMFSIYKAIILNSYIYADDTDAIQSYYSARTIFLRGIKK